MTGQCRSVQVAPGMMPKDGGESHDSHDHNISSISQICEYPLSASGTGIEAGPKGGELTRRRRPMVHTPLGHSPMAPTPMARSPMALAPTSTPVTNPPRTNALVDSSMLDEPHTPRHAFPAVFFLDSRVFQLAQVEMPRITMSFSPDVISFTREAKPIATHYFEDVHTWMPIVSRYRFYNHLMNPLLEHRSDLTILLFCMRLISWSAVDHADGDKPRTRAYLAAKRLLVDAESAGILTLQILQAIVLVAIYEVGHGIYPAAYVTIGTCARYGTALGIDRQKSSDNGSPSLTEVEQEERRRVWWAIVILDRFGHFGLYLTCGSRRIPCPSCFC